MKKLVIVLAVVFAVGAFLFVERSSLSGPAAREEEDERMSGVGDKDNPDAAFRFRYAMLAGNQQDVDLVALRRQALSDTKAMGRKSAALRKTDALTWTELGPGNIGGRVRSILINPSNSAILLAGSVSGGIWKTSDGGGSWKPMTDTLDLLPINTMLIDPTNSATVYAGTGEGWASIDAVYGGGIYKSTDFGDTWALLPSTTGTALANFRNVMKLASDSSGNIYAATKDYNYKYGAGSYTLNGGLFKSTNGGASWTKISSTAYADNYFNPSDVVPVSSTVIVFAAGANGSTAGGIFRTTNSGAGWSKIASNLPTSNYGRIALAQDPNNANTLFAVIESYDTTPAGDGGLKGIYRSTDAGATWTQLTTPQKIPSTGNMSYLNNQGWYDNVIAVDPNNSSKVFVGGVDIMKTTNGGTSWSQVTYWDSYYGTPAIHADHHALVFDKTHANTLYSGDDGGIYKTTDGGASWTSLNNGLAITQFYSGAVYRSGATYHGGTQDNGHLKYSGTGTLWTTVAGGDGGYSAQDQSNALRFFEEYVYLAMSKTTTGGVSWNNCISGLTDANDNAKCLFIAPFAMDPENSAILVAGSDKVWITSNSAATWTQSSNTLSASGKVSAVAVVNASSAYLGFAGTTDGKVFKCTSLDPASGIDTWSDITPPGNNGAWVRRVAVDLTNRNRVFVTYGAYNTSGTLKSRHVWYTSDQGGSWNDISTNLPNVPVHTLVIDPNSATTLYVGTETGVFSTTNTGGTWTTFSAGMPWNVPTDELVVQADTKALFAFTHGRGVFSTSPSTSSSPGWTIQTSGLTSALATVKAVSQSVAWAAGAGGKVLLTTNGGTSWNQAGGGVIGSSDIYAVEAVDASTALVTTTPGASTFIYRTTNGGSTWNQVFTQTGGFVDAMHMVDASNGIAVGDPVGGKWTILKTTDGGATWAHSATEPAQSSGEAGYNNSMASTGSSNIWFGTSLGSIYRTTDGGITWSSALPGIGPVVSVAFSDAQHGVAGMATGSAARTTDGGASWTPVTVGGAGQVAGLSAFSADVFAAQGGNVYRSTDRGSTWNLSFNGSIGELTHLSFALNGSSLAGWTVTATGNIAGFGGTLSEVGKMNAALPHEFALQQNFPNPFNPSTRFRFSIPSPQEVTLKIFDGLGREIATLIRGEKKAGTYEAEWDATGFASGVYFYSLTAGTAHETKKMLLLK